MSTCERCGADHDGSYGSGRFCSTKCARGFSTASSREAINKRVSEKLQTKLIDTNDDVTFATVVARSSSWRQLGRDLGFDSKGGNVQYHLRKRVIQLGLSVQHFVRLRSVETWLRRRPGERKGDLKKLLLQIGRKYECVECGLGPEWNGKKLTIQVDHINGDKYDHQPDNLRFLCPNCHSQTSTFTWKNVKKY